MPVVPAAARRTTVTHVTDGDTVVLAGLGSSRLIGIDTPEVYYGAECFGHAASAFTSRELPYGTSVYYVRGPDPTDRYGRDLVYIWLRGGTFLNGLLVKDGYATTLTIPPNTRYAGLFHRLATRARQSDRGLWSPSTCNGHVSRPIHAASSGSGGGGAGSSGPSGDKDCSDFSTQAEAQRYFIAKGGPGRDPDLLDADHDGKACETLP